MSRLMIRRLTVALAVLAFIVTALRQQPPSAFACSCMIAPPPTQARDEAVAVFAGTVSAIAPANPGSTNLLVTFDLDESWKGPTESQLTITTPGNSAACGVSFDVGQGYLVYASAQEGQFQTTLCSRTAPLGAAGEDLAALGTGTPIDPAPTPVSSVEAETPWLPIVLVGGAALVGAALFGGALLRRRPR